MAVLTVPDSLYLHVYAKILYTTVFIGHLGLPDNLFACFLGGVIALEIFLTQMFLYLYVTKKKTQNLFSSVYFSVDI